MKKAIGVIAVIMLLTSLLACTPPSAPAPSPAPTPTPTPAPDLGKHLMLDPDDLGAGWAYELELGSSTYGGWTPQYGGRVIQQAIYQLVDIDDDTKLIKGVQQLALVYPDNETAIESEYLKGWQYHLEPLDLPFWDEAYLGTSSDKQNVEIALRKANELVSLTYREEIRRRDILTGEFRDWEYPELNQEKTQWAGNFLRDLSEAIQRKMVAQ